MSTTSPRRNAPTLESLRPMPRLRPAQVAPVRRGQPAGGEGIPGEVVVGWGDGCAPSTCNGYEQTGPDPKLTIPCKADGS
jgi:hypothetical protein